VLFSNNICQLEILDWLRTQADCLYNNKLIEMEAHVQAIRDSQEEGE